MRLICNNTYTQNKLNFVILPDIAARTSCRVRLNALRFMKATRMWANAQRDGRPAEHRWRPLFNAAKFG